MDALLYYHQQEHINMFFSRSDTHCKLSCEKKVIFGDNFNPVTQTEDVGFHCYLYSDISMIQRRWKYADDSEVIMCGGCKCTVLCQSNMTHSICANITVAPAHTQQQQQKTLANHVHAHKRLWKCNLMRAINDKPYLTYHQPIKLIKWCTFNVQNICSALSKLSSKYNTIEACWLII